MFSFLFAFLGAWLFWVLYFVVSFFVGSLLIKHIAPTTYSFITGGELHYHNLDFKLGYVVLALTNILFWHVILAALIVWFAFKLFFGKLIWPLFCKGVVASVKLAPNIKIEK